MFDTFDKQPIKTIWKDVSEIIVQNLSSSKNEQFKLSFYSTCTLSFNHIDELIYSLSHVNYGTQQYNHFRLLGGFWSIYICFLYLVVIFFHCQPYSSVFPCFVFLFCFPANTCFIFLNQDKLKFLTCTLLYLILKFSWINTCFIIIILNLFYQY